MQRSLLHAFAVPFSSAGPVVLGLSLIALSACVTVESGNDDDCDPRTRGCEAERTPDAGAVDAHVPTNASATPSSRPDAAVAPSPPDAAVALDSDGDGFLDGDDPAPNDPANPGNFSSPEAILADPRVKAALDAVAAKGFKLPTHLEREPADSTGYFTLTEGDGQIVATRNGSNVGEVVMPNEQRIESPTPLKIDTASVSFSGGVARFFSLASGAELRGTGNEITTYSRSKLVCTEPNSDYTMWSIVMGSAQIDPTTGNRREVLSLVITIATAGVRSAACAQYLNANYWEVGGWRLTKSSQLTAIDPAQLRFMCTDENHGYVPLESWTRADGTPCSCTLKYEVACTAK